ncbi:uncharacterized protein LY79DRAFT_573323 [Colletotrichum navitas]|uniref:Uncharacterized protein n=1 Tax=Colletotrichum navitas TaxID=681940 RepID=A0AAD8PJA7_9PEZI|nr:uncharacterized protein LY79DRAFT_573323 [Colletotrichum navitas]KAK1564277.1 hypothetical protein LY79DRAFT_573323 [Colletotrichum navitas]
MVSSKVLLILTTACLVQLGVTSPEPVPVLGCASYARGTLGPCADCSGDCDRHGFPCCAEVPPTECGGPTCPNN